MNIENINKAIAVMKRAQERGSINMSYWQCMKNPDAPSATLSRTEAELHACGNTACFAGHLAISPEWQQTPGCSVSLSGCPVYETDGNSIYGESAIAKWLNIGILLAFYFTQYRDNDKGVHILYDESWEDVEAAHVIRELSLLRDIGETEYRRVKLID